MKATERLRRDHEALRATLALLTERLLYVPIDPHALQPLAHSLAKSLRLHARNEAALVSHLPLHDILHDQPGESMARSLADHDHQRKTLAALTQWLAHERDGASEEEAACASQFIHALEEEMAQEEGWLFSAIDRLLSDQWVHQAHQRRSSRIITQRDRATKPDATLDPPTASNESG